MTLGLDEKPVSSPAAPFQSAAPPEQVDMPCLEAVGLECVRNDRVLFSNLSFCLRPGELIQIDGPNGSGKTSLLRILSGLALPTEGEVRWRGKHIQEMRSEFLQEVSYIGHSHGVKQELTPLENLRVARALTGYRTDISLDEALARVGLCGFEDVPVRALSAGQCKRVALARLLLSAAPFWVLDEPFNAVDKAGKKIIEAMLEAHCGSGGMAVLTTHQPMGIGGCSMTRIHLDL